MNRNRKDQEVKQSDSEINYTYCLNCGTELNGKFCHNCGQQSSSIRPTVKDFVLEYLNNAFIWDPLFFKTLWSLVCRPGQLTKDFMAGKFYTQENPLKLNMFLLFVFITMFLIFSGEDTANKKIDNLAKNELIYAEMQLDYLKEDSNFASKLSDSPRDTVMLYAPLNLEKKHPDLVKVIKVIDNTHGERADKWVAEIPRILIDENIVMINEDNYYIFNTDESIMADGYNEFKKVLVMTADFTTTYFPMLMLLTAPFLAFSLALIQRRKKQPLIKHFIFSLHYTAFIELMIMFIYTLYLITHPSMDLLQWILRICAIIYLVASFRSVYEPNSWFKSIIKALLTYIVYLFNCLILFILILIIFSAVVVFMDP